MRSYYLDRIRVVLTVLVIAHHSAITFGASGSWFLKLIEDDSPTSILLTLFAAINQAFFMGFFFLIAGYFTPPALVRKGFLGFARDRLIRLGLPLLVFGLVLGPLTVAIASGRGEAVIGRWLALMASGRFVMGPMWFAYALLLFSAAWCLWVWLRPGSPTRQMPVPGWTVWAVCAFGVGLAALLIRQAVPVGVEVLELQLGYFASYVFLFTVGCVASHYGWLSRLGRREVLPWTIAGAVAIPLLPVAMILSEGSGPVVVETGFSAPAVFYAFWEPVVAWAIIATMLWRFRVSADRPSRTWSLLAENSYGAFVLHPPVIVTLALLLEIVGGPPVVKFVLLAVTGATLSFALSALIRLIPGVRRVV